MREFYKNTIDALRVMKGVDQIEGWSGDDLEKLMDALVAESKKFKHIPWEDQCRIITKAIIEDREFYGLNVGKIHQYLSDWWSSQVEKRQRELNKAHKELTDQEKKQAEFYKKQLERERAKDPNYDPMKKALQNIGSLDIRVKTKKEELRSERSIKESWINQVIAMSEKDPEYKVDQKRLNEYENRIEEIDKELDQLESMPGRWEKQGFKSIETKTK